MTDRELRRRIAANIKAVAAERGLSLYQLSVAADVGSAQIYRVTRAEATPTVEWLARVAAVLGVDVAALMGSAVDSRPVVATIEADPSGRIRVKPMQTELETKGQVVRMRVGDVDVARLEALARHYEMPTSAVLRMLVRNAVASLSIAVEPTAKPAKRRVRK